LAFFSFDLQITRKLVEGLGGKIFIDSEVDVFSKFTIEFPHTAEVADTAVLTERLRVITFVLVDDNSDDAEQVIEMFRVFQADFVHFESLDVLQSAHGSAWSPSGNRTYVCLIRCELLRSDVLEGLFVGHRFEIITFGDGRGLVQSSQHYPSLKGRFPAGLMRDVLNLSCNQRKSSFTRIPGSPVLSETELAEMWKNLKVLVAEDNLVNQKVCRRLLNRIGVRDIVIVPDGRQAVDKDASQSFDVVLMVRSNKTVGWLSYTIQCSQYVFFS
jgi:hypothetical protein